MDNFNPIAKSFSLRIENKYDVAKYLALFAGSIDTDGIAKDAAGNLFYTTANPDPVRNYAQSAVDAVMTDGVLPVIEDGALVMPDTKGGTDYMQVTALNPQFRVRDLKKYLRSNCYLISRIIIKAQSQEQFDNPMTFKTSSPTENLGSQTILPTNYSTPEMLQTTKIIIDNIQGTVLQDDTMMFWQINAGETVSVTFEFLEKQQ